ILFTEALINRRFIEDSGEYIPSAIRAVDGKVIKKDVDLFGIGERLHAYPFGCFPPPSLGCISLII
ncbi:hypothetical protein M3M33_13545, partial [Loigolactobacillus coryniformis]|uniref:hypothetical protein n=1 Tax=Loigolactobacillus coryniformis TaxID=1610 RepID=UPI00201ADD1E